jgi:predicted metal-binding membrane protein
MRRFPGRGRNFPASPTATVAALPVPDRVLIAACIALITFLAWLYLVHLDRQMAIDLRHVQMMAERGMTMDMPCMSTDVSLTFAMWVVMMVGMMAPSASPMLMLFGASRAGRGERGVSMATLAFGLGYVAVWAGFSLCATFAQWALHQAAILSSAGMALSSGHLSGGVLIAAGIYQLTAWKSRCLTHCRSPLGFLMTNWRDGTSGAFGMGLRHGIYCLGCCWALMCVLFAVGVMNLVWIAILAVLVLAEKIGPAGAALARFAGVALVLVGVLRFVLS